MDDNYSDDELMFLPYYTFLTSTANNSTRRAAALASLERSWRCADGTNTRTAACCATEVEPVDLRHSACVRGFCCRPWRAVGPMGCDLHGHDWDARGGRHGLDGVGAPELAELRTHPKEMTQPLSNHPPSHLFRCGRSGTGRSS